MNIADRYDWVVIGDHPGALLSGCLAARLGLSVLMLPARPSLKSRISQSGQCHDPDSNYIVGMGNAGKLEGLLLGCLKRLDALPAELASIRSDEVLPQILSPGARLLFSRETDRLSGEFDREFGKGSATRLGLVSALEKSEAEVIRFWRDLPERLTLQIENTKGQGKDPGLVGFKGLIAALEPRFKLKRKSNSLVRALGAGPQIRIPLGQQPISESAKKQGSPELGETLQGLWYAVTGTCFENPVLHELVRTAALSRTAGSFPGGVSGFRELLLRLARRLGVHIFQDVDCQALFVQGGSLSGVQLAQKGKVVSVAGGMVGCALEHIVEKIPHPGRPWPARLKKSPKPEGWKFTLAFSIREEAIPPGMNSHLIWHEAGAPPLEIELADPFDYGIKKSDQRVIFARTVLPFTPESLTIGYQRLVAARIFRQMTEILPFLEFHVIRIFPDFRPDFSRESPKESNEEAELAKVYPFSQVHEIPENLRVYSSRGTGARSGIEGLFVGTREAYPELGSLGPTVAAVEGVAWLAHRSGLSGPFV